jgi:CMP-N,N'-diacetyllegionaminic acid synthase
VTGVTRPGVLALIPARGGSKSIPRKNLLRLAGKPLVAYSIEQALASGFVTRTIVSTDDEEIASVARAHGAEVPFMRPAEFAQDDSTDLDVFRHALATLRDREGYTCECVVHLRPTGPVRRVAVIDEAIELMLRRTDADSLRSVTWPAHTPYKMWRISDGYLTPLLAVEGVAEPHSQPRQRLPEVFWQNGYVDIVRPRVVLERGLMCGDRTIPFVVHEPVLEIDYLENIPAVEAALVALRRGSLAAADRAAPRHPI